MYWIYSANNWGIYDSSRVSVRWVGEHVSVDTNNSSTKLIVGVGNPDDWWTQDCPPLDCPQRAILRWVILTFTGQEGP